MQLNIPQFFGWHPISFHFANETIDKGYHSGKSVELFNEITAYCFHEQSEAYIKKFQDRLNGINMISFSSYWAPNGDLNTVLGIAAVCTAVFITDDFRDNQDDPKINDYLTKAFCQVPELISNRWEDKEHFLSMYKCNFTTIKTLTDEIMKEFGYFDQTEVDGCVRFLVYGSIITYMKATNEDMYQWYIDECKIWEMHSYNIRFEQMEHKTVQDLMEFRYGEGGTTLLLSTVMTCGELCLTNDVIESEEAKGILISTGMHICLLNDIFSFDREVSGPGAEQNCVEYHRKHHAATHSIQEGIDLTMELCNDYMDEFLEIWQGMKETYPPSHGLYAIATCCLRNLFGNITWSMDSSRYTRKQYIQDSLKLKLLE